MQTQNILQEQSEMEREYNDLGNQYEQQKIAYIDMNNFEGELHSQMADMRGSTTTQMANNKQLEVRIS